MLGGSKSEIGEEGRCLCTISLNKAAVVRAHPEEHQGPFTERKEMLKTLSFLFLRALVGSTQSSISYVIV